ncbi:CWC16 protein [Entophlyctis helioformis]|nr:CWC16 protein [Entophlyctis helioformis]
MAERRAANKYYPPDWDPSKGSINTFVGQHPLRERARKLDQGILVVRFEMPFNVWCLHCEKHIGMGVRFNAEKKKVGKYYTTPILSFRMKCHLCSGWIEIHTDPKNSEYTIISGARRREEGFDAEDAGVITLKGIDDAERERLQVDAFYKLETVEKDKEKQREAAVIIDTLSEKYWKDPFTLSQKLRKRFRVCFGLLADQARAAADVEYALSRKIKRFEKQTRQSRTPSRTSTDSSSMCCRRLLKTAMLQKPYLGQVSHAMFSTGLHMRSCNCCVGQGVETHEQKRSRIASSSIFSSTKRKEQSKTPSSLSVIRNAVKKAVLAAVRLGHP